MTGDSENPKKPSGPSDHQQASDHALLVQCSGTFESDLLALLDRQDLGPRHITLLLKNPFFPQAGVERISQSVLWLGYREVKSAFARHPKAPRAQAITLIAHLFWRELHDITMDFKVHAMVRRYAENALKERLQSMPLGATLSLAKMACRELIGSLKATKDVRVMEMLLINPRLVEADMVNLCQSEKTQSQILSIVGRNPKWSKRRPVVMTLLRNPATPIQVALGLVPQLHQTEAKALARLPRLSPPLKAALQQVMGANPWPPKRR